MPNARGHLFGGMASYFLVGLLPGVKHFLPFHSLAEALVGLCFCLFGALLPDIDTHSEGRKLFNVLVFICIVAALNYKVYVVALLLLPLPLLARLAFHRGITHNPVFVCVVPLMVYYTMKQQVHWLPTVHLAYYTAYVVGAMSHIILDLLQNLTHERSFIKKNLKRTMQRRFWW